MTTLWCPRILPQPTCIIIDPCWAGLSDRRSRCRLHPGTPAGWWLVACVDPGHIQTTCTGCSGHSDPLTQWSRTTAHMRIMMIPMAIAGDSLGLSVNRVTGCRSLVGVRVGAKWSLVYTVNIGVTCLHPLLMIWLSQLLWVVVDNCYQSPTHY